MNNLLSAIIPTFNEADNIAAAIDSLGFCDEIMVVDSFSEDETVEIAKQKNAIVHQRKYTGPADQKNWAIPKAKHEWVFILDADERVTPELQRELTTLLQNQEIPEDAFWIGRQSYFMGKKVNYSGWQKDKVVRLMRRDKCRYDNKQVHEEIDTSNIKVGMLQEKMIHYTYKSMDHFMSKMDRYAKWSAQDYLSKTSKVSWFHLNIKPAARFLKHYILQLGFLDGKVGYQISKIMAWGVRRRYEYLQEILRQSK